MLRNVTIALFLSVGVTASAFAAAPAGAGRTNGRTTARAVPAAAPAAAPTRISRTVPVAPTAGAPVALESEYAALGDPVKSIFQADRTPGRDASSGMGQVGIKWGDPGPVQPVRPVPVFRAALIDDVGPMAVLEFQEGGAVSNLIVRPGQYVSRIDATVTGVSLDTLQLQSNGGSRSIPIGFATNGTKVDGLPAAVVSAPVGPVTPATAQPQRMPRGGFNRGGAGLPTNAVQ